jgi:nitrate reductase gamma subunit
MPAASRNASPSSKLVKRQVLMLFSAPHHTSLLFLLLVFAAAILVSIELVKTRGLEFIILI